MRLSQYIRFIHVPIVDNANFTWEKEITEDFVYIVRKGLSNSVVNICYKPIVVEYNKYFIF